MYMQIYINEYANQHLIISKSTLMNMQINIICKSTLMNVQISIKI